MSHSLSRDGISMTWKPLLDVFGSSCECVERDQTLFVVDPKILGPLNVNHRLVTMENTKQF